MQWTQCDKTFDRTLFEEIGKLPEGKKTAYILLRCQMIEEGKPGDPNRKRYAMIGFGCSISMFKYRKNNKRAEEVAKAGNRLIYGKIEDMFVARFNKAEQKYYESIGSPLRAIFSQDQNIQSKCHHLVVKFAEEQGIKMDYETRLD